MANYPTRMNDRLLAEHLQEIAQPGVQPLRDFLNCLLAQLLVGLRYTRLRTRYSEHAFMNANPSRVSASPERTRPEPSADGAELGCGLRSGTACNSRLSLWTQESFARNGSVATPLSRLCWQTAWIFYPRKSQIWFDDTPKKPMRVR
jgi:hypothetical protein